MSSAIKETSASQKRYNNKLFKRLIRIYDPIATFLAPVRNRIVKDLRLPEHAHILDVACGTGTQALLLAKQDYQVVGIDLSREMLARAKSKIGKERHVRFVQGDATKLPFKNKTFDASTISFGLHDMPENVRTKVLREMKRVTKRGGRILIADYATPPDGILAKIERPISNLFESKYFDSFMRTGLNYYLKKAGLVQKRKVTLLMGIAQLVICMNH